VTGARPAARGPVDWPTVLYWACWPVLVALAVLALAVLL
jgi:hypothetical protein